ncbi:MAG: hypothetical protein HY815_07185 [Candidatus Riflebacteria bacterium]|nr:hypothetical protein [Candidatus Riflebacteria bacterium]
MNSDGTDDGDPAESGAGYQDLVDRFRAARLALPPIPGVFRPRLRRQDSWVWSTRPIEAFETYMFRKYIGELFAGPVEAYVAVCHAGRGINSYGLQLHLVYGPLALFTQDSWGGAYSDEERSRRDISGTFESAAQLVDVVDQAPPPARSRPGSRCVVLWSSFRGHCAHTRVSAVASAPGEPGGRARGGLGGPDSRSEGPPISEDPARLGRGAPREADEPPVAWSHRGPMSGMGWFPAQAGQSPVSWVEHRDKAALFAAAALELRAVIESAG